MREAKTTRWWARPPARIAIRTASIGAVAIGLWLALRGVSLADLGRALGAADLSLLVAAVVPLLGVGLVLRALRYGALLPSHPRRARARFADVWTSVALSTAGNNVLPLRGGELLRTRETVAAGYPLRDTALAQVTEKVVEGASIVICVAPALIAVAGRRWAIVTALVCGLGVPFVVWAARRLRLSTKRIAIALVWSILADAVEVALIAVCLVALGQDAAPTTCLTVFGAVNLAIALPSTPGNIGALEAGAALPLMAMGVDREAAIAFALVYRVVQWVPVTLLGAAIWLSRATTGTRRPKEAA